MNDLVTVTKKRVGRPKAEFQKDSATRQRTARSKAHSQFLVEPNIQKSIQLAANMSTSNLIALLPKLMALKWRVAVETVCGELVKRVNDK